MENIKELNFSELSFISTVIFKKMCLSLLAKIECFQENANSSSINDLKTSLESFHKKMETLDEDSISSSFKIAVLPLNTVIRPKNTVASTENTSKKVESNFILVRDLALECMLILVQKTKEQIIIQDSEMIFHILLNLCFLVAKSVREGKHEWALSENSHLAIIRCLCEILWKGIDCNLGGPKAQYLAAEMKGVPRSAWLILGQRLAPHKLLPLLIETLLKSARRGATQEEGPQELAVEAIRSLQALGIFIQNRDVWSPFFPGIFSGLYFVARRGKGYRTVSTSLWAITHFVVQVCSDDNATVNEDRSIKECISCLLKGHGAVSSSEKHMGKLNMLSTASEKTQPKQDELVTRMRTALGPLLMSTCTSTGWKVRAATVGLAATLVISCSVRFEVFMPMLLEVLIGRCMDQMPQVSEPAKFALESFKETVGLMKWADYKEVMVLKFWDVLISLPKLASDTDQKQFCAALDLVTGYLEILGKDAACSFESNIERLMLVFRQVFEFNDTIIQQVPEPSRVSSSQNGVQASKSADRQSKFSYFRKPLKHIRQNEVEASAKQMLGLLGTKIDVFMLYNYVLTKMQALQIGKAVSRNSQLSWLSSLLSMLYAVNGVFAGSNTASTHTEQLAAVVLPAIIGSKAWLLPSTLQEVAVHSSVAQATATRKSINRADTQGENNNAITESHESHFSAQILQSHAQLVSLLLETIGYFAEKLGVAFDQHIMRVLYPVLERAADGHPVVRHTSLITLHRIAFYVGYDSLQDLLNKNLDYITDALCARLRFASTLRSAFHNQKTVRQSNYAHEELMEGFLPARLPGAIEALFEHAGAESALPLLEDVVHEVLVQVDLNWQRPLQAHSLMRVLRVLVKQSGFSSSKSYEENPQQSYDKDQSEYQEKMPEKEIWLKKLTDSVKSKNSLYAVSMDTEEIPKESASMQEIEEYFTSLSAKSEENSEKEMAELQKKEEQEEKEFKDPPQQAKIAMEVLDRCSFFIATKDLKLQTLVLEVVLNALNTLKTRRRLLLPQVHKLWHSVIVARLDKHTELSKRRLRGRGSLKDKENTPLPPSRFLMSGGGTDTPPKALLIAVFNLIGDIAELVGDFLSIKFDEDIWPHLKILFSQWTEEAKKRSVITKEDFVISKEQDARAHDSKHNYCSFSIKAEKAALRMLLRLSKIPACHRFIRPKVPEMAQSCLYYLSSEAENSLREQAIELFSAIASLNGDSIWFMLCQLAGMCIASPIPGLEPLNTKENIKFSQSAKIILNSM